MPVHYSFKIGNVSNAAFSLPSIAVILLATISWCFAQQQKSVYDETYVRKFADAYGISSLKRPYKTSGQLEISDLQPMLLWLHEKYGGQRSEKRSEGPLREIHKPFMIILREDADSKTFYGGEIQVRLSESFDASEKAAAFYMSNVPVVFQKGAFSGGTVGDWTVSRYDNERNAILMFLRKNAFVRVSYQAPTEVSIRDKRRRQDPDPSVKEKCEAVAREVDERLAMMPLVDGK